MYYTAIIRKCQRFFPTFFIFLLGHHILCLHLRFYTRFSYFPRLLSLFSPLLWPDFPVDAPYLFWGTVSHRMPLSLLYMIQRRCPYETATAKPALLWLWPLAVVALVNVLVYLMLAAGGPSPV